MDEKTQIVGHYYFIIAVALVILLVLTSSGCTTVTEKEYFESGQLKRDYKYEGMIPWSNSPNKFNPELSVIGK